MFKIDKMKYFVFVLFNLLSIIIVAQSEYSAMLLSLQGEGYFERNGVREKLKIPTSFKTNDEIHLISGTAEIMLFSGGTQTISMKSKYIVPKYDFSNGEDIFALANSEKGSILTETSSAYSVRGYSTAFPIRSKVLDINTAFIIIRDTTLLGNSKFILKDYMTQKVLWEDELHDSIISFDNISVKKGTLYSWSIETSARMPLLGTIEVMGDEVIEELLTEPRKTEFDYIKTASVLISRDFYFDAYNILQEANVLFKRQTIFSELLNRM